MDVKNDKREKKIAKLKEIINEKDYSTKENEDLDIPSVPELPKLIVKDVKQLFPFRFQKKLL